MEKFVILSYGRETKYQRELSHYQADTRGPELRRETGAHGREVLAEATGLPREDRGKEENVV